jgi:hypothetical protein
MRILRLSFLTAFLVLGILLPKCWAEEPTKTTLGVQDPNGIFPKIEPIRPIPALFSVNYYAKQRNLQPLSKNHLRFFEQLNGIVSEAVDVNLITGDLTLYPPTHDKGTARKTTVNPEYLAELREILTSKEFLGIPQQNEKFGMDGHSDIIEVDMDGSYLWKIHWVSEDPNFINTVYKLNSIFSIAWVNSYTQKLGLQTLRTNQVRLIEPDSKDTYLVIEIDLTTGKLKRYQKNDVRGNTVNSTDINQLIQMLNCEEFRTIAKGGRNRISGDGRVIYMEVDIDGSTFKKMVPSLGSDDKYFKNVIYQIKQLVFKD